MSNSMISWPKMVYDFHEKYGHHLEDRPTVPDVKNLVEFRQDLQYEELSELHQAMNVDDLVEIADGIADLIYVLIGTALSYGIPIELVFREFHRSNMTKAGKRADGKTIKGPDFEPPQIAKILGLEA